MLYIILSILAYLVCGVLWLNKMGKTGAIENPIQSLVILFLWPISYYLYNK